MYSEAKRLCSRQIVQKDFVESVELNGWQLPMIGIEKCMEIR